MSTCSGCGIELPDSGGPSHAYVSGSPACWAMFGELMARDYSDVAYQKSHRLLVDAYAAQHSISEDRRARQSLRIHGAALVAQFEMGWSNDKVVNLLRAGAEGSPEYDPLDPPPADGKITIRDIHAAQSPDEHGAAVADYAQAVHESLSPHNAAFRRLIESVQA